MLLQRSGTIFKGCVSAERFNFLIKCPRFDDKQTRSARRQIDRFTHICFFCRRFDLINLISLKILENNFNHFYNSTKDAVDTVNQMCSNICTNRKTKRWPMCVFYNILNLCAIYAYSIYVSNNVKWS